MSIYNVEFIVGGRRGRCYVRSSPDALASEADTRAEAWKRVELKAKALVQDQLLRRPTPQEEELDAGDEIRIVEIEKIKLDAAYWIVELRLKASDPPDPRGVTLGEVLRDLGKKPKEETDS